MSSFYMASPDGNHYVFGTNERSGLDFADEGKSYTSAWYLDTIATPYGKIQFKYRSSAQSFSVNRFSVATEGGKFPYASCDFRYEVRTSTSQSRHVFDQVLPEEIEWNGNKVQFSYSVDTEGFTPYRLDSMTVRDAEGNVRKTVMFRYETWASAESRQPGREMLTSVEDSEAGSYSFSYNGIQGAEKLPSWNVGSDTATRSDLWGYYNSSESSLYLKSANKFLRA